MQDLISWLPFPRLDYYFPSNFLKSEVTATGQRAESLVKLLGAEAPESALQIPPADAAASSRPHQSKDIVGVGRADLAHWVVVFRQASAVNPFRWPLVWGTIQQFHATIKDVKLIRREKVEYLLG